MTIEERLEALTMNLELASRDIQDINQAIKADAENIRALARIAELHHERLSQLEDRA